MRCGGGGGQGNKHTDNWTDLCDKLIGSLHETLSVLYEGLETGAVKEIRNFNSYIFNKVHKFCTSPLNI